MIIRKGYKYALRTTPYQRKALYCFLEGCNTAYNRGLELQFATYKYYKEYIASYGKEEAVKNKVYGKINKYALMKMMTEWRKADDEDGILFRKTPAAALQQTLLDLDIAYTNFFQGRAKAPSRKLQNNYGAFRIVQMKVSEEGSKLDGQKQMGYILVPKLGKLHFYLSRPWVGLPKNATISLQGDRWFISIQTEYDDGVVSSQPVNNPKVIGIDIGITPFLTLSNGEEYHAPMPYEKSLKRIQAMQKDLKRSIKDSENYKKKLLRFDKLHNSIANIRKDWLNKITTQLAITYDVIYIPEIYVTKWDKTKSTKQHVVKTKKKPNDSGNPNNPRLNGDESQPVEAESQQKAITPMNNDSQYDVNNLETSRETRRRLRDVGIGEFERQLTYKMADRYKELMIVPTTVGDEFDVEKSCVEKARLLIPK